MNSLIAGLVAVIGALGGFYFGAKYGQGHPPSSSTASTVASTTTASQSAASGAGAGANGGGGGGGGAAALFGSAASGQITAVNGNTITVHDRQSNKDIKVNIAAARITKTDQGTASDLTTNTAVTVVGQTGADGTVSAQVITIGGGGAGGFGGGRRGGGSPSPAG
jgi:hypothetical protein